MKQTKQWLKDNAIRISELKVNYKDEQRKRNGCPTYETLIKLSRLKFEYRHKHIAYSELKGNERSSIEQPREDNKPDESIIEKYKNEILERMNKDENVCYSS